MKPYLLETGEIFAIFLQFCLRSVVGGHSVCSGAGSVSYLENMVKELTWQKKALLLRSCQ